jgi:2-polyprenyl-3-methyl-5-hydroxy-6-metoxy-1,4-benzoquinol methylase
MDTPRNTYNEYAAQYAAMIGEHQPPLYAHLVVPTLLNLAGDVAGLSVLDAGCGEGVISRVLADLGASVTAIDVSEELIRIARSRTQDSKIEYCCFDLSEEPPERFVQKFDMVVSNLVIDDVPDYVGYIRSVALMAKQNARIVLTKNNPYSAMIRDKVTDYFDSGHAQIYRGMASEGVRVFYYHRTLEEYITGFCDHGFLLSRLSDMKPSPSTLNQDDPVERDRFRRYMHFPFLMAIEFIRESDMKAVEVG